jgi:acyl-coenzyme A synthetase/AMP-(fatty) acid ligase
LISSEAARQAHKSSIYCLMIAASSGEASYGASFAIVRVSVGQHVWFTTADSGWTYVLSQSAAGIMTSGTTVSAKTMCFTL